MPLPMNEEAPTNHDATPNEWGRAPTNYSTYDAPPNEWGARKQVHRVKIYTTGDN